MSGTRGACTQCRAAKSKCEYAAGSSSCNRCLRRHVVCSGSSPGSNFQFRDENEVARRNSRRARQESKGAIVLTTPLEYRPDDSSEGEADPELQRQFPWLNSKGLASISEPLKRDVETRAIDRFFIDWTMYPYKHRAPGYFAELPRLYHNAPQDCVLTYAVRAIAFADMKNTRSSDPAFYVKARRNYGAALTRMRELAQDEKSSDVSDDSVLAGLLLIDSFELMYLARTEPLGLHDAAVRHVLHLRGDDQFHSRSSYQLWSLAHRRLQFKHMLTREEPDQEEVEFMSKLNARNPDIHFSLDVLHMNHLVAAARKLVETPGRDVKDVAAQAEHLVRAMQSLLNTIESWTMHLDEYWRPKKVDSDQLYPPNEVADGRFPSPPFLSNTVLEYQDVWFAGICNFHAASQIVLRESMIEVLDHVAHFGGRSLSPDEDELITAQKEAIVKLATCILESVPTLLGYSEEPESREPYALHQGRMVGRNCVRFPALVLSRARYVPTRHGEIATRVMEWIKDVHGLS